MMHKLKKLYHLHACKNLDGIKFGSISFITFHIALPKYAIHPAMPLEKTLPAQVLIWLTFTLQWDLL